MRVVPVLVFVAGCDLLFPPDDGPDDEALIVAAEGGEVVSADGVLSVTIPAGALSADTEISIRALTEAEWPDGVADLTPISLVYALEPDGTEFLMPVEFTWIFDAPPQGVVDEEGGIRLLLGASHAVGEIIPHDTTALDLPVDGTAIVVSTTTHFSEHWLTPSVLDESGPRDVGLLRIAMAGGRRAVHQVWPLGGLVFDAGFFIDGGRIEVSPIGTGAVSTVSSADWNASHAAVVSLSPEQEWRPPSMPEWRCDRPGNGGQQLNFLFQNAVPPFSSTAGRAVEIECVDQEEKVEYEEEIQDLGPRVEALPVPGSDAVALGAYSGKYGFTVDVPPGNARRGVASGTVEVCPDGDDVIGVMYYPKYGPGFDYQDIDGCTRLTNRDPDLWNNALVVLTGSANASITTSYVE